MENLSDELRSQWHPSFNLPRTIETTNISAKVWWIGTCGHEWETTITERLRGSGCPVCVGKKILIGLNDLASQNSELAKSWHPQRNLPLLPTKITPKSGKKVWWICELGHEWQASIRHRSDGSGCPFCSGHKILQGFNDLATTHPQLLNEWHPTRNSPLLPTQISIGKKMKIWWLGKCGHEWDALAYDRYYKNLGCVYCSGHRVLVGFNDLATTHPSLISEWNFLLNNPLMPTSISAGSNKAVEWICKYRHRWDAPPARRSSARTGCPVCSGNKVLRGFNDIASQKSHLLLEWHPTKNTLNPSEVSVGSGLPAFWICKEGHEWQAKIIDRSYGIGCNICSSIRGGKLKSTPKAGVNDLASQFPGLAKEFSSKNHPVTPEMIHIGTGKRYWWECSKGHEWETPVHYRTGKDKTGCPVCAPNIYISRQEATIKSFLESLNLTVETSDRKILKGKEIDLYIPAKKVGIEFNGIYWHTEENGKDSTYHYDKWRVAKSAGVELIQIWEDDFRDRKDAVLKILARKLGVTSLLPTSHPEYADEAVISDSAGLDVVTLPVDVAKDFLRENAVQGVRAGSHYLGLKDVNNVLKAVLVLNAELRAMSVISYISVGLVEGGFRKLLEHATITYSPASFIAVSDNCLHSDELLLSHGFVTVEEVAPDYRHVVNNERRDASEYDVARFQTDDSLVYQAGLDVSALATLNNMPKIWDAGGMKYRLSC